MPLAFTQEDILVTYNSHTKSGGFGLNGHALCPTTATTVMILMTLDCVTYFIVVVFENDERNRAVRLDLTFLPFCTNSYRGVFKKYFRKK